MDPLPSITPQIIRERPAELDIDALTLTTEPKSPSHTDQVGDDLLDAQLDLLEKTLPENSDFADITDTVVPLASILLDRGDTQSINRAHGALCEVSNMGVWTVESSGGGIVKTARVSTTTAANTATSVNTPPTAPPKARTKSPPGQAQ